MPHLLHQPQWFKSDKDLLPGDLVYFMKKEGKLATKWMEHCVWKTHFDLKYQLEDEDPVHRTIELRSYVESDWEELETDRWDTGYLWDNNIAMEAVLGMGQA